MEFWIASALLTFGATIAILLPLTRRPQAFAAGSQHDVEVYRDQLQEVDADERRGLIDASSADQARTEISRRILLVTKQDGGAVNAAPALSSSSRWLAFAAVIAIPLLSWGIYSRIGSPDLPSQPLAERLARAPSESTAAELVAKAEAHLATNPDDGRGWDVLAPIYLRSGRGEDAVHAFAHAIRINGESAARLFGMGEALVEMSDGSVSPEAEKAFQRAVELDPSDVRPLFFLASGLMQQGKLPEAATMIRDMLEKAPADVPWREQAQTALADIEKRIATGSSTAQPAPAGPSADDVAAAKDMSTEDRNAMIEGMVASLASRLKDNPDDLEGWKRLVRSYVVLGMRDKAQLSFADGINALSDAKRAELTQFGSELGLAPTGTAPTPAPEVKP